MHVCVDERDHEGRRSVEVEAIASKIFARNVIYFTIEGSLFVYLTYLPGCCGQFGLNELTSIVLRRRRYVMPMVPNPTTAKGFAQGYGLNDLLRRLYFPGLPAGNCIHGVVFFPGGTGATFPIPCDRSFILKTIRGGVGTDFVKKAGSAFVATVAELAGVSRDEAEQAVARAAGLQIEDLKRSTVLEIGRKIFDKTTSEIGLKYVKHKDDVTVGDYFSMLANTVGDLDPAKAVSDLAKQTGMSEANLKELQLDELGDHLDSLDALPGPSSSSPGIARGTTVCVQGNGQVGCGVVSGWLEGALWGGLIGGAIGGGVGGVIGGIIGAIIGWLF